MAFNTKQALNRQQSHVTSGMAMAATALLATLFASGCAKNLTTGSVPKKPIAQLSQSELHSATNYWSKQYKRNPKDLKAGLNFATALRTTGRNTQALAVMQQVVIHHPKSRDALSAYGKALAGAGDLKKALEVIQRAQTPDNPDWKLHSAEGTIYDQLGEPELARQQYRKALDIEPNEPSVLSNLGMSHLLTGDLKSSEQYLRSAIDRPGADSRVRQNLALVVGLQGRFEEAETIAAGELSPEEAQANVAFLRQMLSEQNSWNDLKDKPAKKKTNG